jgi:carbamoyl-phosphate synthase large subunit
MHAAGNDYIFILCYDIMINSPELLSARLSDRHTGIGGDGIVLIGRSESADAEMRMYNADGSEGNMCGNAIRCVGKLLYETGAVRKAGMRIATASGIRELFLSADGGKVSRVRVDMGRAKLKPGDIPVILPGDNVISRPVKIGGAEYTITCVSMGNPHAVIFVSGSGDFDLRAAGPVIENSEIFPDRANVEFVWQSGRNLLDMRVWERGSGETMACGTGACAAAVAAVLNGKCAKGEDITVRLPGGDITVNYTDETVFMTGGCEKVFEGVIAV